MSKVKKILVATDFSECSKVALERASALAARFGAELDVLHVWEVPVFVPPELTMLEAALGGRTLVDLVEKRAGNELDAFVEASRARGISIGRALAKRGAPSLVLVQVAERENYDVLVLGTHGRTGISHAVMGSVAERVVRHSPCPVLTVRGDASSHGDSIRRILVPIDYSAHSRAALAYAAGLAEKLGASLDVMHVWERPLYAAENVVVRASEPPKPLSELIREDAEREMEQFLRDVRQGTDSAQRVPLSQRVVPGEPASTLLAELEKGVYDLAIAGARGHTGLKHLLLGSVAEKLVRLSPVPVLTVPRPGHA